MRQRLRLFSFVVALICTFASVAPLTRASGGSVARPASLAMTTTVNDTDASTSVEPQTKKRGNGFVRVLSAPFRALAKIFGGGKKRTGDEAKSGDESRDRKTVREQSAHVADTGDGARGATEHDGEPREEKQELAPVVTKELAGGGVARVESKTSVAATPTKQGANIIRPEEMSLKPFPTEMWIPVIEGISKDHLTQGRALLLHGYLNEAISELSIASTIGPNLIEANNLLGLAYDKRGWHKQAIECYERALALAPDDPQILNNLGYSLYLDDQFNASLKRLKRAARYAPGAPVVLNNLGLVQARLGQHDDAFKSFARAGGEYDARLRMAQIHEQAGRDREAIKHYEAALRIQPNSSAVLEHLAALYDRTGRRKEAEEARRALGAPPDKQRTATGGGGG